MGSTGYPTETKGRSAFDLWVDCAYPEHGDQVRRAVVAHATSPRGGGERCLWVAVRYADGPEWWHAHSPADVSALCVIYGRTANWFYYKEVPETMGPGDYDVPDKVWRALTPLVDPEGCGYAAEWRQGVSEFRASVPEGSVRRRPKAGELVTFDHPWWGDEYGTTFTFLGRSVFLTPDGERVRLRSWSTRMMTVKAA